MRPPLLRSDNEEEDEGNNAEFSTAEAQSTHSRRGEERRSEAVHGCTDQSCPWVAETGVTVGTVIIDGVEMESCIVGRSENYNNRVELTRVLGTGMGGGATAHTLCSDGTTHE